MAEPADADAVREGETAVSGALQHHLLWPRVQVHGLPPVPRQPIVRVGRVGAHDQSSQRDRPTPGAREAAAEDDDTANGQAIRIGAPSVLTAALSAQLLPSPKLADNSTPHIPEILGLLRKLTLLDLDNSRHPID
jgi:hypothetical protein